METSKVKNSRFEDKSKKLSIAKASDITMRLLKDTEKRKERKYQAE